MDIQLDYLPRWPKRRDTGIGCIGAGFIMRDCHLVAYRQAGFNPVAIASRHPERAREAAQCHGIPRVNCSAQRPCWSASSAWICSRVLAGVGTSGPACE